MQVRSALEGQFEGPSGVQVALGGQFAAPSGVQVALAGHLEAPSGVQVAPKYVQVGPKDVQVALGGQFEGPSGVQVALGEHLDGVQVRLGGQGGLHKRMYRAQLGSSCTNLTFSVAEDPRPPGRTLSKMYI